MLKQKGFTIIELIVVIAIIAVLAGIVLVNVTQYIKKAKDTAVKADFKQMQTLSAQMIIDGAPDFGGFCSNEDYGLKVLRLIANANVTDFIVCYDGVSNTIVQGKDVTVSNPGASDQCKPSESNPQGKWYAYDNNNYCVDSTGKVSATTSGTDCGC